MAKKKSPQAPGGTWRYGIVKRKHKTVLEGYGKSYTSTYYDLVEVYDRGRSWTAVAVEISSESKAGLIRSLESALEAVKKYDVIVQKKVIVHRIGSMGKAKKK